MFLLNWFSGNNNGKSKKKSKKKKQTNTQNQAKLMVNPMKEVKMYGFSKMGYGPKKTECQDSYCIMDKFIEDCHFFAGIIYLKKFI